MPSDDSENEEDYEEGEEDDDDDDDDDDDGMGLDGGKFDRFKIETQKDEMASDIEDDNEEDYLTDSQAWGKNKRQFYDTDFVDKDFRSKFFCGDLSIFGNYFLVIRHQGEGQRVGQV